MLCDNEMIGRFLYFFLGGLTLLFRSTPNSLRSRCGPVETGDRFSGKHKSPHNYDVVFTNNWKFIEHFKSNQIKDLELCLQSKSFNERIGHMMEPLKTWRSLILKTWKRKKKMSQHFFVCIHTYMHTTSQDGAVIEYSHLSACAGFPWLCW